MKLHLHKHTRLQTECTFINVFLQQLRRKRQDLEITHNCDWTAELILGFFRVWNSNNSLKYKLYCKISSHLSSAQHKHIQQLRQHNFIFLSTKDYSNIHTGTAHFLISKYLREHDKTVWKGNKKKIAILIQFLQ